MNRRPRLEITAPAASAEEAAAVVAALEQFMRTTAPPAADDTGADRPSPWVAAALREGVDREPDRGLWS